MIEEVTQVVSDLLAFMTDNPTALGFIVSLAYVIGPSWMVFLEKRQRLSKVVVWAYALIVVPIIVLGLLANVLPESYCGDPLSHEEFRFFYPLWLPLLPLFWFYLRSEVIQHPYLYAAMLVSLSVAVFLLTFGYEVFHYAYQQVHGTGIAYSGAVASECASLDGDSVRTARQWRDVATAALAVVLVLVMVVARRRKQGLPSSASATNGSSSDGDDDSAQDRGMPKM